MAVAALAAFSTSCVVEEKECEKNNTGEITMVNDNPFEIQVDVINSQNLITTEVRTLAPNASTTYTVPAGIVTTLQVKPEGWSWTNVDVRTATQCVTSTYTWAYCSYDGNNYAKEVSVTNNTGQPINVNVGTSFLAGTEYLLDGQTVYYYNVVAGELTFWAQYIGGAWSSYESGESVSRCGTYSFTWNAGKKANSVKSNNNIDSAPYLPFQSLGTSSIKK